MQTESTGRYRSSLPQLQEQTFLTDGGLETDLIFNRGVDLPCFASFPLVRTEEGRSHLREYIMPYVQLAREYQYGFVLESFTWRANRDWAERLGMSEQELHNLRALCTNSAEEQCTSNPESKWSNDSNQSFDEEVGNNTIFTTIHFHPCIYY